MEIAQIEEYLRKPAPARDKDQLIVNVLGTASKVKPQAIYAEFPVSPDSYGEGFSRVTCERFANVMNGLAWWLTAQIGKSKILRNAENEQCQILDYHCKQQRSDQPKVTKPTKVTPNPQKLSTIEVSAILE